MTTHNVPVFALVGQHFTVTMTEDQLADHLLIEVDGAHYVRQESKRDACGFFYLEAPALSCERGSSLK